jgi:hypothetical protein
VFCGCAWSETWYPFYLVVFHQQQEILDADADKTKWGDGGLGGDPQDLCGDMASSGERRTGRGLRPRDMKLSVWQADMVIYRFYYVGIHVT